MLFILQVSILSEQMKSSILTFFSATVVYSTLKILRVKNIFYKISINFASQQVKNHTPTHIYIYMEFLF